MPDPIYEGIIHDKGGEVLNVLAYGIDNTGATNVTSALQGILNGAPDHAVVVFPAGTYKLSGVTVYRPVRLVGPGTLLSSTTGGALVTVSGGSAKDVVIDGLTFQTGTHTGGSYHQRYVDVAASGGAAPARVTIRNNQFLQGAHTNAIRAIGSHELVIESNHFEWSQYANPQGSDSGADTNALVLVGGGGTSTLIRGNRLRRLKSLPGGNRGLVVLNCSDVQITNNMMEVLDDDGVTALYSSTADDTASTAIQVWSSRGVGTDQSVRGSVITGNTIVGGNGARIYLHNDVLGSVVANNAIRVFDAVGMAGIVVGDGCDRTVVCDNVIEGGANDSDGILLFAATVLTGEEAWEAAPAYCLVHGNTVQGCRHGIRFGGYRNQLRDNLLFHNRYPQLTFMDIAKGSHVYDNYLDVTSGFGSEYSASSGNSDNVFRRVSNAGVQTYQAGAIT